MRTFEWLDLRLHYNEDYSGLVRITRERDGEVVEEMSVPFLVVEFFVLRSLRDRTVEELEQAGPAKLREFFGRLA